MRRIGIGFSVLSGVGLSESSNRNINVNGQRFHDFSSDDDSSDESVDEDEQKRREGLKKIQAMIDEWDNGVPVPRATEFENVLVGRMFGLFMIGLSIAWLPVLQVIQGGQLWDYIQVHILPLNLSNCSNFSYSKSWLFHLRVLYIIGV